MKTKKRETVECEMRGCPHNENDKCTHRCVVAAYNNGRKALRDEYKQRDESAQR